MSLTVLPHWCQSSKRIVDVALLLLASVEQWNVAICIYAPGILNPRTPPPPHSGLSGAFTFYVSESE